MNIEEFLSNHNMFTFPSVSVGSANTVAEFYQKAIITVQNADSVIKWHNLLVRYMNDPEAIILSRLYESEGRPGDWHTRRGMLTRMADGFSYACASNHFARIIFTMAYYDFVPEYEDLKKMFTERKFSLSSFRGATSVERDYAAFRIRQYAPRFYTQGWYLAHIMAVKKDEYLGYPGVDLKSIITLGSENQWQNINGYYVRKLNETLSEDQKKIAKAQFLRFVDPINYFLVPNQRNCSANQIGENTEIVNYMRRRYSDQFGGYYADFMEKALVNPNLVPRESCDEIGHLHINVSFGEGALPQTATNVTSVLRPQNTQNQRNNRSFFSNQEKARCLKAYLFDGFSFRRIEMDVLHLDSPARGGGFKGQMMMRDFGLVKDNKGMFSGRNLMDAINQSNGVVKIALEFIRDNI